MKIELGKTKIKGFRFKHLTEGVVWDRQMERYVDKEGVIMSIHHEHIYQLMRVKFEDGNSYAYPLEMAKQYIVEEETIHTKPSQRMKDIIDSLACVINSFEPVPSRYTKEDLIPNFLIGGYASPKQNEVNRKMSESCKRIAEEISRIVTKHQNKNNMKNLKITAPEGYEIDKVNSTFENIVFKPIKKELPKSWEELKPFDGSYVNGFVIESNKGFIPCRNNKNIFATKEQAEASLALAQLSQLREVYRDGWKPDWCNQLDVKYTITPNFDVYSKNRNVNVNHFLSFQSAEVRDLFLENFRDLIEQAKPLMS